MCKPIVKRWCAVALVMGLVVSCGLIEPKESEPNANQAPETILTAYPPDVYDHTVTFHWKGQDMDGTIQFFETSVDRGSWQRTTSRDTTIVFSVADNAVHTFAVRAIDDDGDADPTPAERTFTATSIAPETVLLVAPSSGARVGPAITVELDADDPDDLFFTWRCRIDDGQWTEWMADSAFAFALPAIVPGALGILPVGTHTFYGQARDASGLEGSLASVSFEVIEGTQPTTTVALSQINSRATYADYSAFTAVDNKNAVHYEVEADASTYSGVLAGFSHIWCRAADLGTAQFSAWTSQTLYDFADVAPGQYWFILKARDTAGSEDSSPESLFVDIVDPRIDFNPAAIVLVQETRNGTGAAGSPRVTAVNEYYGEMLAGRTYSTVDYAELSAKNWRVSPRVAGRAGLILWIDDDRSDHWLFSHTENMRFLREYVALKATYSLAHTPHLLLSHWNLPGASNVDMAFLTEVFGVASPATNGNDRTFVSAQGVGPLAGTTLSIDATKVPGSWQGIVSAVWAFDGPAGATPLTTWVGSVPSALDGRTNAYYNAGANSGVAITGYPLYFMTNAPAFMTAVLQTMGF